VVIVSKLTRIIEGFIQVGRLNGLTWKYLYRKYRETRLLNSIKPRGAWRRMREIKKTMTKRKNSQSRILNLILSLFLNTKARVKKPKIKKLKLELARN